VTNGILIGKVSAARITTATGSSREEFNGVASQPATSAAFKAGQVRGLIEGRDAGREDKQLRNEWDLEGQRELEQADSGYDAGVGPRAEYQAGYREAFRRGYREGFGQRN